jgi:asparagine synthase (glutamine-hydrolysing)
MSIIFGVKGVDGDVIAESQLVSMAAATTAWAQDGTFICAKGRIGMGFQPFHTHQRSNLKSQPTVDKLGNMVTLDGRLDNYKELCELLNIGESYTADSLIVLAAFMRWGEGCFAKFIGDWAVSIWSEEEQSLYLARDHAGTRTLYYEQKRERVLWSTFLETFFVEEKSRDLDEIYAASYLGCQSLRDLTPYKGVFSVTPAHYIVFHKNEIVRKAHWQWMVHDVIRYSTDREYDEHFLALFRQSVDRRAAHGDPVLSQLSGGMDSTAIVCISDERRKARGAGNNDLLDTVSYFDDSEPGWDERYYFSITEARRGKVGIHIQNSFTDRMIQAAACSYGCQLLPGAEASHAERERILSLHTEKRGSRVMLSGIGGDELLGGIPTPFPELADDLVALRLGSFFRSGIEWGIALRLPLLSLAWETMKLTSALYAPVCSTKFMLPEWMTKTANRFLKVARSELLSVDLLRYRPTAVSNGMAWWSILETLPHTGPLFLKRYEYRYPFLDRDLVDFLFRIPRTQIICPGRRRYLMRRALREIVPVEILERKRKAQCTRSPASLLQTKYLSIAAVLTNSLAAKRGLIKESQLLKSLADASNGVDSAAPFPILRALSFELWLRSNHAIRGSYAL